MSVIPSVEEMGVLSSNIWIQTLLQPLIMYSLAGEYDFIHPNVRSFVRVMSVSKYPTL